VILTPLFSLICVIYIVFSLTFVFMLIVLVIILYVLSHTVRLVDMLVVDRYLVFSLTLFAQVACLVGL